MTKPVIGSLNWGAALNALLPDNGKTAVGHDELVLNVRDFGAKGDGATDDSAAFQAAFDAVGANTATSGGIVRVTGPNAVFVVSAPLTIPRRVSLEIPNGTIVRRLSSDSNVGPLFNLNRNHGKIFGGGSIECQNACSSGIVRIERTDGTCEWCRLHDIQLVGPGKTTVGSTGLVFSGTTTFQNRAAGMVISDVETGVRLEGGANMNHCTDITFYNIGTKVYDLVGSIECTVMGGSVSSSSDVTVFTLSGAAAYNRFMGFAAEPGGAGAFMFNIGASALNNQFLGVIDNIAALGTDSGTRTLKLFTSRLIFPVPTTANSSLELPHGAAPSSPINGAVWTTTAGMFVRINGVTKSVNLT